MITIEYGIDQYEVEIMDGSHLKYRIVGTERWCIPLHFAQVEKSIIDQLDKQGYVNSMKNFFITPKD